MTFEERMIEELARIEQQAASDHDAIIYMARKYREDNPDLAQPGWRRLLNRQLGWIKWSIRQLEEKLGYSDNRIKAAYTGKDGYIFVLNGVYIKGSTIDEFRQAIQDRIDYYKNILGHEE